MAAIKKYQDKDGNTRYQFQIYLGTDPLTGKKKTTRRRGFKTKKEAQIVLSRLELDVYNHGLPTKNDNSIFSDIYQLWFTQYQHTGNDPHFFINAYTPVIATVLTLSK